jgi:hypothetical protein
MKQIKSRVTNTKAYTDLCRTSNATVSTVGSASHVRGLVSLSMGDHNLVNIEALGL